MTRDFLLENGFKDSKQKNGNLVKYDGNESVVFTAEMVSLMDRCTTENMLQGKIDALESFRDGLFIGELYHIRINNQIDGIAEELSRLKGDK